MPLVDGRGPTARLFVAVDGKTPGIKRAIGLLLRQPWHSPKQRSTRYRSCWIELLKCWAPVSATETEELVDELRHPIDAHSED